MVSIILETFNNILINNQPREREREREREIKSFSLSSSFFFFSLLLSLPFPLYVWILLEYDFAIFVLACCYFSCVDPNRGSSCSHEFLLDTLEVVRDLKTQRTHLLVHENVASLELHQRKRRLRARHESIATRLLALALATTSSVRRKRVSAAGQTRAGYASSTSSSVHRHSPPPFHLSAFSLSLSLSLSLLSFLFGKELMALTESRRSKTKRHGRGKENARSGVRERFIFMLQFTMTL